MIVVSAKVRFAETDMMGVVHHANYFRWFEMGRVEYLRQAGISLLELMAEDIIFPIRNVTCKYISSAYFDDEIKIEAAMIELSRAKIVFSYRILRAKDDVLIAVGTTQNVFTNKKGQILRLSPHHYDKLKNYCSTDLEQINNAD